MRRRLTNEEREVRQGAGIGFRRWWPWLVVIIGLFIASMDQALFQRCLGTTIETGGRAGAAIRTAAAIVCHPMLLLGSWSDWALLAALWAPLPFAILNWRWAQRHRAYWHGVRRRENERRAEKRRAKIAARKAAEDV